MVSHRQLPPFARTLLQDAARIAIVAATLAVPVAFVSTPVAQAEVFISVGFAPPALPVYAQPICPGEGYLWTPGYWAYGPEGYYWVPGTWVRPPLIGYLWTPGYWGWGGSAFLFHPGYWGPHVGFYGGINYGFGYEGVGYEGGYWRNGGFYYNRSVNHLSGSVRNIYEHPVMVRNAAYNHVSFNGGNGGVPYRASAQEEGALRERHIQPTGEQMQHQNFAARDRQQFASVNHGHPAISAAPSPAAFRNHPNNFAATRDGFGGTRPGGVNQRDSNQQQRIANGVRTGQMTGGALTSREHQQGNREQPRMQAPPRQAAPRAEGRPAPAGRQGGGHENRR